MFRRAFEHVAVKGLERLRVPQDLRLVPASAVSQCLPAHFKYPSYLSTAVLASKVF